jgi:hypothetical protein
LRRNKHLYFLVLLFGLTNLLFAQKEDKIRFKKNASLIYFFQKEAYRDTFQKGLSDVFYLIVPDSLKPYLSIQVDNAQLLKTENDSLVTVNYVKGFNYESIFIPTEQSTQVKAKQKSVEFKTLVNGVSAVSPDRIEITFIDKRQKNVLLKNVFYFIEKS